MTNDNETSQTIKHFATIQRDDDTQIRVALNVYKEHGYIDVRQWWKKSEESTNEFKPSARGFTIPVTYELNVIEELIEALGEAKSYLEEHSDKEEVNA